MLYIEPHCLPQLSASNGNFTYILTSRGYVEGKLVCDTGYYAHPNADYYAKDIHRYCQWFGIYRHRQLRVRGPTKCLSISRLGRSFFMKHITVKHLVTAVQRCLVPSLPNGAFTKTNITFGSTVSFSCNTGYTLVGAVNATCSSNQTWSRAIPSCVKQGNAVTTKLN